MYALILPLAYAAIFLSLGNSRFHKSWFQTALRAALVWFAFLVTLTEILSLFNGVRQLPLLLGWTLPVLTGGWLLLKRKQTMGRVDLPRPTHPENRFDGLLLGGVLFFLAVSACVALLAPPNTYDSLNYHMARVAHWAQNGSLAHFATGVDIHNSNTPGAEMALLNVYVLSAGDRFVNLVSWMAMLGSALGVAVIAARLGGGKPARRLAMVFAVTVPMGIAQASSTMNDFVVAFWLVCVAAEMLTLKENDAPALVFAGLAAGAAFLTKATSAAYLLPFGVWTLVMALRHLGWKRTALYGAAGLALALALCAGFAGRNLATYGSPIDRGMAETHTNELRTWQGVTSNVLRTLGQQMSTPFAKVNAAEYLVIEKLHQWMGLNVNDPRTTSIGKFRISLPNYNEVRITNPAHIFTIFAACLIGLARFRKTGLSALLYALTLFVALTIYAVLFKWQIFGARLHLSFFVLFAPFVGLVFDGLNKRFTISNILGLALLVLSLPWLFHIESRPLLPTKFDGPFSGKTLFDTPRADWYFAGIGSTSEGGRRISETILQSGCKRVGILISGSSAEYQYWALLGAPRDDFQIEWLVTSPSERYRDPTFTPCAVICENCTPAHHPYNLPVAMQSDSLTLFLKTPEAAP